MELSTLFTFLFSLVCIGRVFSITPEVTKHNTGDSTALYDSKASGSPQPKI